MRPWLLSVVLLLAACGGNAGGDAAGGAGGGAGGVTGGSGGKGGGGNGGATAPKAIGGSCPGAPDSAKDCQSMLCLGLADNAQKQGGICSKSCQIDDDCGGAAFVCVDLANDGTGFCVHTCQTPGDCSGGFACLSLNDPADPISICFVEAPSGGTGGASGTGGATGSGGATGTGGTTAGADCASKACEIYTDADMITGYCAMKPNTKKLCDCPTLDVPATCAPTNPAAANLYCCP